MAIIAAFHATGAVYDSRNLPWLFSTPRHQADATSRPAPGKRTRTRRTVSSRLAPPNPGAITVTSTGAPSTPRSTSTDMASVEQREDGTRGMRRGVVFAAGAQRRVDRDERARERAFAEEVLEKIGDPERRVEGVRRLD